MFLRPASPTQHRKLLKAIEDCSLKAMDGCCFGYCMMAAQAVLLRDTASFDQRMTLISSLSSTELAKRIQSALRPLSRPVKQQEAAIQQTYIDVLAFLSGITLYQNPLSLSYLFPVDESEIRQGDLHAADVVMPQKLLDRGGLDSSVICYGMYTADELDALLDTLSEKLHMRKIDFPVAFILSNAVHALTLGFDPKLDGWFYLEVHGGVTQKISREKIVACLNGILTTNDYFALTISSHVAGDDAEVLRSAIVDFQASDDYKRSHTMITRRLKAGDSNQTGLVYTAVANHDAKRLAAILKSPHVNVNQVSVNGISPLHYAVIHNYADCVRVLLDDPRTDVNSSFCIGAASNKYPGSTALHLAVENNYLETLSFLLKRADIKIDQPNKTGATALMLAVAHDYLDAAKMILAAYPETLHTVIDGMNAYDVAELNDNRQMMEFLQSYILPSARKSAMP